MGAGPLEIVGFSAVVIGTFVGLGAYISELSGGNTAAGPIAAGISAEAGEQIFWGKGKCATCHSIGGEGSAIRCPNLGVHPSRSTEPVGLAAGKRKPGVSAVAYLVESLYEPSAFVVPGFPDGVMTPVHRPPIALEEGEIRSLVLFLLSKSGLEADGAVTQEIVAAQRRFGGQPEATVPTPGAAGLKLPPGDADRGRELFAGMQCSGCHDLAGVSPVSGGATPDVGPDLTGIGAVQTEQYLLESVLNPSAVIVADPQPDKPYSAGGRSLMPEFAARMTVQQALDLVAFLKSTAAAPARSSTGPAATDPETKNP